MTKKLIVLLMIFVAFGCKIKSQDEIERSIIVYNQDSVRVPNARIEIKDTDRKSHILYCNQYGIKEDITFYCEKKYLISVSWKNYLRSDLRLDNPCDKNEEIVFYLEPLE